MRETIPGELVGLNQGLPDTILWLALVVSGMFVVLGALALIAELYVIYTDKRPEGLTPPRGRS